jgi:RNA polymerase sigma-70 factor (ECF subfamily)
MNALHAYSSSLRPTVATRRLGLKIRHRKTATSESSPSASRRCDRTPASSTAYDHPPLVQQAIDGNSEAHEQIVARHGSQLRGIAFAILRNREDAEDAVQDGFCRAFASLQSFQGRSSFSTWLTRIVINSSLMIRRKRNGRCEASLDELLDVDSGPNPEQICAAVEIRALVEKQVRQLPSGLQTAFQLYELDDQSVADSMQALGIGSSAFKSRISRARRKIAKGLRQTASDTQVRNTTALQMYAWRSLNSGVR